MFLLLLDNIQILMHIYICFIKNNCTFLAKYSYFFLLLFHLFCCCKYQKIERIFLTYFYQQLFLKVLNLYLMFLFLHLTLMVFIIKRSIMNHKHHNNCKVLFQGLKYVFNFIECKILRKTILKKKAIKK